MSNADRPAQYVEYQRQNGSNQVAVGEMDDRSLTHDQFREKAIFHAYRLLSGANMVNDHQGFWTIKSDGNWYYVSEEQMGRIKILVDATKKEILNEEGRVPPFSIETQVAIYDRIRKRAEIEFQIPPERLRVMYIRMDQGGCGFYRVIQPNRWMQMQKDSIVHCEETNFVSYPMFCNVDMVVIPRQCTYQTLAVMMALKRAGKTIIYETDDLLNHIPDWNPAKGSFSDADLTQRRQMIMDLSDAFIVSTPELKDNLKLDNTNTHVVFNGIDHRLWPLAVREHPDTQRINIMWAGSDTHSKDLSFVVRVFKRLLSEFKGKIMFTFIGFIPEELRILERRGNEIACFVKKEFEKDIRFLNGCPVQDWPRLLDSAQPDICIAPLVDCEFNRCKSEIKVLESWALGCPIVATDIEPYRRAITHGENGFLAKSEEQWHTYLRGLIIDKQERFRIGGNGIGELKRKYVMEKLVYQTESALLKIAMGKDGAGVTPRKQCNEAIKRRIEDLEYEGMFATGG